MFIYSLDCSTMTSRNWICSIDRSRLRLKGLEVMVKFDESFILVGLDDVGFSQDLFY